MAAKRLKVFQAHLGFYDMIVAAPSQKAALEAWGAGKEEFAKGFARMTSDPTAAKIALAHPGRVLRRPFGTRGEYRIDAEPVAPPKLTVRQRKSAGHAEKQKSRREGIVRKEAERELKQAQQEEIRLLKDVRKREAELEKEKSALREKAASRIARAKARLAGVSER